MNNYILNNITSKKHEGIALVLTLIVVGVGLLIIAFMFDTVVNFARYFSETRQVYVDTVTARSYIERVKGEIVAVNIARVANGEAVLHGEDNLDSTFPEGAIKSLNGLLITSKYGDFIINDEININGPQRVEVRVYDANYSVEGIATEDEGFPHDDIYELPPSFLYGEDAARDWTNIGDDGSDYNKYDEDPKMSAYENYGAYLIRVRIYNTSNTFRPSEETKRLVRTTEEAFIQYVPTNLH